MILLLALGSSTDSCQELDIYAEHLEKQVFHYFPAWVAFLTRMQTETQDFFTSKK